MYFDEDMQEVLMERGGVTFMICKLKEIHSVQRGLVTADQKYYRKHAKVQTKRPNN
jgi:hypothetical protein